MKKYSELNNLKSWTRWWNSLFCFRSAKIFLAYMLCLWWFPSLLFCCLLRMSKSSIRVRFLNFILLIYSSHLFGPHQNTVSALFLKWRLKFHFHFPFSVYTISKFSLNVLVLSLFFKAEIAEITNCQLWGPFINLTMNR